MKIKKNDNVIVLAGKDKGKTGKVLRALPKEGRVIVEGINIAKKRQKSRRQGVSGEVISKTMPIDVSNVAIIDPKTKKATRVGYKVDGGKKVRVAKASGQTL
ncbi:MAG: ribosomal protein [Candidatus Parcubacteria bacterium]|jgi:large subunit ribosomal protein L24